MYRHVIFSYWILFSLQNLYAQSLPQLPVGDFVNNIFKESYKITSSIDKTNAKVLARMNRKTCKLRNKLMQKDSALAYRLDSLLGLAENETQHFESAYNSYLDTLTWSIRFLTAENPLNHHSVKAIEQIKNVENTLLKSNQIAGRLDLLKQALQNQFPGYGEINKYLKHINKEAYYFSSKIKEYKSLLKDRKKLTAEVLSALYKNKRFTQFFKQNSTLASYFNSPASPNPEMQTRAMVQQLIAQRLSNSAIIQNRLDAATSELSQLQQRSSDLLQKQNDEKMPDFKPNSQHNKSFLKRLEVGYNIGPEGSTGILPGSTNLAIQVGYRINDNNVVGLGTAYRLGVGKPFKNIKLSNEGVSFRSYVDIKFWKGYWISGGFEYNYLQTFASLRAVYNLDIWQKSGLLGLSKKYKAGKKEAKIQILWDFLSYGNIPRSQPILIRFGYNLK
ncbi:hypothetical protein DVR12_26885 [Chitinophaga silvatica]|uniref:Uncharacterized protein n=1 Tax=Chitinophaga silvatica TaxID=2282649 RepID=A0A3E1Y2H8_9BACT|nr:hypothetical protein [Chitinophaga silvatica]RFS18826.1 hypothetical protein DVR12_26885 [Chitinophaga silvatica]